MKKENYIGAALITSVIILLLMVYTYHGRTTGMVVSDEQVMEKPDIGPAVAGMFYPSDKNELASLIDYLLSHAETHNVPEPRGLVSPHAGYIYSGITAAHGFKALEGHNYNTVIVIGPSHHYLFNGAAVPDASHYRTPLGEIKISPRISRINDGITIFQANKIFMEEHSIEVELPFLQQVLGNFELIPIVTGRIDPERLASLIIPLIDNRTLVVASSDLSHYHSYEEAIQIDSNCTSGIPQLDFEMMERCEACGKIPVLALMHIAKEMKWKGMLFDYRNSGDTAGMKGSVVGYASVVFYKEEKA